MEKENKIETVNQKSGMTGLETATFIVTLISAALSILFTFIALCAAQDPYFGGVQAMSSW